jgi:hypothetical protein
MMMMMMKMKMMMMMMMKMMKMMMIINQDDLNQEKLKKKLEDQLKSKKKIEKEKENDRLKVGWEEKLVEKQNKVGEKALKERDWCPQLVEYLHEGFVELVQLHRCPILPISIHLLLHPFRQHCVLHQPRKQEIHSLVQKRGILFCLIVVVVVVGIVVDIETAVVDIDIAVVVDIEIVVVGTEIVVVGIAVAVVVGIVVVVEIAVVGFVGRKKERKLGVLLGRLSMSDRSSEEVEYVAE